ncbi:MAG: SMP-30/gluconolactonase/LRE family protein [Pirellulales bacterium]|nr:SMP-30/gluconolactonase/LRE family protein [Pirellulales bacterium]
MSRQRQLRRSFLAFLLLPPFALAGSARADGPSTDTPGPAFQSAAPTELPPSNQVRPELYATGFEFAEGPALNPAGDLFVVNYRGLGNIGRIAADGTASIFCNLRELAPVEDRKPQANGLKVDRQGRILAADAGGGRLLRIAADGKSVEVLADRFDGQRFHMINDVALDLAGNIYFTDPGQSSVENPTGSFYRLDAKTDGLTRLGTGFAYPNGLAVAPDQRRLCLSESARHRVLIFDLSPDGAVSNQRVLADFEHPRPADVPAGEFVPDGMIFDAAGRLYVAMWNAGIVNVIDPATGRILRQYDAGGDKSTNCHFHAGYLYTTVAAKEAVFRLKLGVPGFDYSGAGPSGPRTEYHPAGGAGS